MMSAVVAVDGISPALLGYLSGALFFAIALALTLTLVIASMALRKAGGSERSHAAATVRELMRADSAIVRLRRGLRQLDGEVRSLEESMKTVAAGTGEAPAAEHGVAEAPRR